MRLQLIRNATLVLDYGGHRVLIDPYFAPAFSLPSYTGKSENPLVELPIPPEQILEGVEMAIISHLHSDHFDKVARTMLPKDLPILCQPGNDDSIRERGFLNVTPVDDSFTWENIHITRTDGHHGLGDVESLMGKVSGFVLRAVNEPILYWAGDTVLCDEVHAAVSAHQPQVIVTHSCGAQWTDSTGERVLIVMDDAQTIALCQSAPNATVIATHMEALDHATVTRATLRASADQAGIRENRLRIPVDEEFIDYA